MALAAYQFPVMQIDEVVDFLNSDLQTRLVAGSVIKDSDFKQPDPQRWRQIYEGLYEMLTTVPFDIVLQQHRIHIGENVDYPEIYDDVTRLCLFVLSMGRVLAACGIKDFVIKDIVKPSTKRLLKIVSAILNFYKFQTGRLEVFTNLKDDLERQNIHFTQLKKNNDEMRKKINSIKASQAENEPRVQELQNIIKESKVKMAEHYKTQAALQKSISEVKASIAEKKAASDQLRVQILEEKRNCEKISRQIVHSPDRLKEDKKRMEGQLGHLKTVNADKRQRLLELHQQEDALKKLDEEAEVALKMMQGIEVDDNKEKEYAAEIAKLQNQMQTNDDAVQALTTQEQETDMLIASKQEKIAKLHFQHQHKMAAAKETLDQLKQQLQLECEQNSEMEGQKKALCDQSAAVDKELEARVRVHEERILRMKTAYASSLEKLEAYHNKLATCWENAQAGNNY